jgi:hypothetical protein
MARPAVRTAPAERHRVDEYPDSMTTIDVTPKEASGTRFRVELRDEDGSATTHEVTVEDADWERVGSGYHDRAELVEASFRFLLQWEPKEDILRSFDLSAIDQYFPQYGETISKRGS